MARKCSINDPEILISKIRTDVPIPKININSELGRVIDSMPVGGCVYGITIEQAKSLCAALHRAGFRGVQRRLPDGKQFAVWKAEKSN
jgi:hypothetical protein